MFTLGYDEFQEIEDLDMTSGQWIELECLTNTKIGDWNITLRENLKKKFDFAKGPVWRVILIESPSNAGKCVYTLMFIGEYTL